MNVHGWRAIAASSILGLSSTGCSSSPNPVDGPPVDTDAGDASDAGSTPTAGPVAVLGEACSKAGALACNGTAQKLQLLCNDGKWMANGTCSGQQICDTRPGPTAGSCQDPLPYCRGKTAGVAFCDGVSRHVCGPDLLDATTATCTSEALCLAGVGEKCAQCIAGQHQCAGDKLKKCAADGLSFVDEATCATPGLCVASIGACDKPACEVDEYRCDGDALKKCNADRSDLVLVKTCAAGSCDAVAKDCRVCVPGTKDCDGSAPRSCDTSGHWTTLAACTGTTPICTAGTCMPGTCTTGDYRCSGNVLEKCNGTATGFDAVKTCAAGLCDAVAKDCDECTSGEVGCLGNRPRSCVAGHWSSAATDCTGSTPICAAGACVAVPVTTVTFPSELSNLSIGVKLAAGGGGRFRSSGVNIEQAYTRSATTTQLDLDFTMSDTMDPTLCGGAPLTFDVRFNTSLVGSFSIVPTGADHHIVKTFTFASKGPLGSSMMTLTLVSTSNLCAAGTGGWNWYPGGTATAR